LGRNRFHFSPEEVESLAEMEHERWYNERVADDWTRGAERNDELKENPYLVEWKELPS